MADPTPATPAAPATPPAPGAVPAAPGAAAPAAVPSASPPTASNGDGSPPAPATPVSALADWRAGLEGEHKEFAAKIANPQDLVKVAWDLRKQNSSMIKVPSENAQPEEIERFRKAVGVPENADDYEFDLGRTPTDADRVIQSEVAKIALETGVPKSAMKALSKGVTELAKAQAQEQDRVALKAREVAASALKKEMGADYESNLVMAKRALDKFGGNELVNVIENATLNGSKLGDHPAVIRAFARIGLRMGEGDLIGAVGSERTQIQERINQLFLANPPGTEKYKDANVQRELRELHSKLHGDEPGAGFGGRLV